MTIAVDLGREATKQSRSAWGSGTGPLDYESRCTIADT